MAHLGMEALDAGYLEAVRVFYYHGFYQPSWYLCESWEKMPSLWT